MNMRLLFITAILLSTAFSLYAQTDDISVLNEQGKEYLKKRMYKEAEVVFMKALSSKNSNIDGNDYATSLNGLGLVLLNKGHYISVDSLFIKALQLRKELKGEQSLEYAESLNNYAKLFLEKEQYSNAKVYLDQALTIRKNNKNKDPLAYAETINNLGFYYLYIGDYKEAKPLLDETASIRLEKSGKNSIDYADSKFSLGTYFFMAQDYIAAKEEYEQLIEINKSIVGENHPDYAESLLCMGVLKSTSGNINEAEDFINNGCPIITSYYGEKSSKYIVIMSTLGSIYLLNAKYNEAEVALKKSLSITRELIGERHSYYINTLNTLAVLYQRKGLYEQAESIFFQSLQLRKELYGENHLSIARAMNSLGNYYITMGNYEQAEPLLLKSLAITKKKIGENSTSYGILLINLASIYNKKKHFDDALVLSEKSLLIFKETVGENHPTYLKALSLFASLKSIYKKDPQAEAIYIDIKDKYLSIYGKKNPDYIISANNLAMHYMRQGQLNKALSIFTDIIKDIDRDDPKYMKICLNIGFNAIQKNNINQAQYYYKEVFDILKNKTKENFLFLSEQERFSLWNSSQFNIELFQSFASQHQEIIPSLSEFSYDCALFSKSLLLNSSTQIERSILNGNDEKLSDLWINLKSSKESTYNIENKLIVDFGFTNALQLHDYLQNSGEYEFIELSKKINEYKEYINQQEKKLFSYNKATLKLENSTEFDWKEVQCALGKDEIAVEFISFSNINYEKLWIEDTLYYALLVHPNYTSPKMVFLCDQKKLATAIHQQDSLLYSFIWKPLESFLKDVKEIFISPSGLLCNVSFSGLQNGDHYIGDDYTIHNLLSTKDIVYYKDQPEKQKKPEQIVLFGGVDFMYSMDSIVVQKFNEDIFPNLNRKILEEMGPLRGPGFMYLPGSKREVLHINKYLTGLHWETSLFTDKEATETRFKSLSSNHSPEVIHISTHGFYFPQPKQSLSNEENLRLEENHSNVYRLSDNPLMRSGLAFTGANHVWKGNEPVKGVDDGILTAYEISNLNLFNTELVVLSACNTGLGDIDHSEGVYGLQRAFRLAGVQTMIVSLWEVPDKETVELMTDFYSLWGQGMSKKEAFDKAQMNMRYTYPDQPEKWAGFIMIE